ncbi:MAG: hypothetical protein ACOX7N_10940, partial [Lawsonibacter sp.]|jgi:hypothetical protein
VITDVLPEEGGPEKVINFMPYSFPLVMHCACKKIFSNQLAKDPLSPTLLWLRVLNHGMTWATPKAI